MQALQTATKISFKNILFLTDFSEASEAAQAYALGFARHYNAQLFPAHAADPVILSETVSENIVEEVVENSQKRLLGLVKEPDITTHPLFFRGALEKVFPTWLQENGIDLIVIGTHGRRGFDRFLLGSTAEYLFRNAPCPVLTVGPHVTLRPSQGITAENVLFPTDLGPHADYAATYALSFARESHGKLTFMHIVTLDESFQHDRAQLLDESRAKLKALIPPDAKEWCTPEMVLEVGDPALEVVGWAEKERPDLIVLGLPFAKQFSTHFVSGVTYRVISQAPCPVLTIRDLAKP